MSSKARGIEPSTRGGVEPTPPQKLVELAVWAETVTSRPVRGDRQT